MGCSSTAPTSTTKSSGGAPTYTYPFFGQIGAYDWNGDNCAWYGCGPDQPAAGTLDNVTGVAVSDQFIFVGDYYTGYISEFKLDGTFVMSFWANYEPTGLAVDAHGHLYSGNVYYGEIDIFDFNGNNLGYVNIGGGSFYPYGVAVGSDGNVYAADPVNWYIYKIAPTNVSGGTVLTVQDTGDLNQDGGSFQPEAIAIDAGSNNVYVTDNDNWVVQSFSTSNLAWNKTIGTAAALQPTTVTGQLYEPSGIAVDWDGNILVGDTQDDSSYARIEKFSPSGSYLQEFANTPSPATTNPNWNVGQLYDPFYIAVDNTNKDVFVTDSDFEMVFKYTAN